LAEVHLKVVLLGQVAVEPVEPDALQVLHPAAAVAAEKQAAFLRRRMGAVLIQGSAAGGDLVGLSRLR
jgi:hypothetical protein